jgi:hypothetical protein
VSSKVTATFPALNPVGRATQAVCLLRRHLLSKRRGHMLYVRCIQRA